MRNRRYMSHRVKMAVNSRRCIFAFLILSAILTDAQGQDLQTGRREQQLFVPKALPSALQYQVQALGIRIRTAGKEETALDAQFVDDVGNRKSIHIVYQFSGMVRIEGVHDKRAVTFDGEFTYGVADRTDESLLDSFVQDTPEGMLYSLRQGASMVLLGHDFQSDFRAGSDFKGPRYDVYLVTAPDRIRRADTLQSRRFYFDSATGLLASTRYSDSAGVNVETRFLNWEHVDGSAYSKTLERYENGRLTFSITVTTATGEPQRNTASFQ